MQGHLNINFKYTPRRLNYFIVACVTTETEKEYDRDDTVCPCHSPAGPLALPTKIDTKLKHFNACTLVFVMRNWASGLLSCVVEWLLPEVSRVRSALIFSVTSPWIDSYRARLRRHVSSKRRGKDTHHRAQQLRRPSSSRTTPWKPQITHFLWLRIY